MLSSRVPMIVSILLLIQFVACAQPVTFTAPSPTPIKDSPLQAAVRVQFDKTAADVASLKLPENRALAYAKLGKMFFKFDKDRMFKLFQRSIDELILAQNEAEMETKNFRRRNDLLVYSETRRKILDYIVYADAELAFKYPQTSRSATVKAAFEGVSLDPNGGTYNGMSSDREIVQQENMLEQNLAERVADQKPDQAAKILKDILIKSNGYRTDSLLTRLYQMDKEGAETIFPAILNKLLNANFDPYSPEFQCASVVLYWSQRPDSPSSLILNNIELLKKLATKTADFLLREADQNAQFTTTGLTPVLVKLLPQRADELKLKTVPPRRSMMEVFPVNNQVAELLKSNASPELLLSQADKFPPGPRDQIYVAAINKIAFAGDVSRAKELLTKSFPASRRDSLLKDLNWQLAYKSMEKKEFDQAENYISQLPEKDRFEVTIALASGILSMGPEQREKGKTALEKAHRLISDPPNNRSDVYKLGLLADVYSRIDPEISFGLIDRMIVKIAYVSEAEAIVGEFNSDSKIEKGELQIGSGFFFSGASDIQNPLKALAKINFLRTFNIIDKFSRREMRISLELDVLENVISD